MIHRLELTELRRQIGIRTATALVVGEVIAVGIFLTPAGMAKALGSPMWLLVVWLAMGAMALCGALCYGELAARYPEAGGGYVYLREAYGPAVAFMYGWMAFLVMDPGLTAVLAVGLATYAGYGLNLSPWGIKAVAIATIIVVALDQHSRRQTRRGVRSHADVSQTRLVGVYLSLGSWFSTRRLVQLHSVRCSPRELRSAHRLLLQADSSALSFRLPVGGIWENSRVK